MWWDVRIWEEKQVPISLLSQYPCKMKPFLIALYGMFMKKKACIREHSIYISGWTNLLNTTEHSSCFSECVLNKVTCGLIEPLFQAG